MSGTGDLTPRARISDEKIEGQQRAERAGQSLLLDSLLRQYFVPGS